MGRGLAGGGHLGKNCFKKSPFVKKQFVPMAAFGNDLIPLVECCHGVDIYIFTLWFAHTERI